MFKRILRLLPQIIVLSVILGLLSVGVAALLGGNLLSAALFGPGLAVAIYATYVMDTYGDW